MPSRKMIAPALLCMAMLLPSAAATQPQPDDTLPVGAVRERSVAASASVEAFRPVGELRVWQFFAKQTTFGLLTSYVKSRERVGGRDLLVLEEGVELNYGLLGEDRKDVTKGATYVSLDGFYAGSKLEIGEGEQAERFELMRNRDRFEGFFTRGDDEQDLRLLVGRDYFAWDLNFIDQLEIYFAMRDLSIGTRVDDTLFSPQTLIPYPISGQVIYFMWQEIYKGRIDSVFIVRLTQPSDFQLYFTPDKRLVRADLINQGVRVYQDVVQKPRPSAAQPVAPAVRPKLTLRALIFKLPHYLAYLMMAALGLVLFTRQGFVRWRSYVCLALGAALYILVPLVQNPAVIGVMTWLLSSGMPVGSSAYLLAAVPPLIGGCFQQGLLLGVLWALYRGFRAAWSEPVSIGAFLGAGFGLAEACYTAGFALAALVAWEVLGASMLVLFMIAGGAYLANAVARGGPATVVAFVVTATTNAVLRYLPFLVQRRVIDVELMHIFMSAVTLAFMAFVFLAVKRANVQREG